jgi:hypothetical protein
MSLLSYENLFPEYFNSVTSIIFPFIGIFSFLIVLSPIRSGFIFDVEISKSCPFAIMRYLSYVAKSVIHLSIVDIPHLRLTPLFVMICSEMLPSIYHL